MAKQSKRSPRITKAADNQAKALELRKLGFTFEQIGKSLKVSKQHAFRYVKSALAEIAKQTLDSAEDLRNLELERLDGLLRVLMPKVATMMEEGDFSGFDRAIRLSESRRKLLGIDAPVRSVSEVTGKDGNPLAVSHGVLLLPAPVSPEEWEKATREAQEKQRNGK